MRRFYKLTAALALALIGCSIFATSGFARQDEIYALGRDDYVWSCMPCHGDKGKGDGPLAKHLVKKPADLTALAKSNNGTFPFWLMYNVVAGREEVPGHETFQMPNFWARYRGEEKEKGFMPADVRILLITHYLESIQGK